MKDFKKKQIGSLAVMAAVIAALGIGTGLSDLSGNGTATATATGHVTILTGEDAQSAQTLSADASADADTSEDGETFTPRSEKELRKEVKALEKAAGKAGSDYEGYIVKLADDSDMVSVLAQADTKLAAVGSKGVLYKADTLDEIFEEIDASEIEYIEPDYIMTIMAEEEDTSSFAVTEEEGTSSFAAAEEEGTSSFAAAEEEDTSSFAVTAEDETVSADSFDSPNDEYYLDGSQWNLDVINAQSAWEYGLDGESVSDGEEVVVAIIDSGINSTHEDIDASHIVEGYSYVTTDTSDTDDTLGHGTFVSGEIFAVKDNEVGIAGIMPEVYIMPLRVFGSSGSAYTSDIVSAIDYATESGEVDVISMSLGGSSSSSSMETACEEAIEAGILITASAGNDGDYTVNYPAAYDCVIGVGSTGTDDSYTEVSSFSSLGTTNVFCTAPGYKLTSTYYESDDSYYTGSGTSFSNPEVAALAAMVKSIDRTTTQDEFKQLIIDTSVDLGDEGRDSYYGYGLIDFGAVVEAMVDTSVTESTVTFKIENEDGDTVDGAAVTITKYDDDTNTAIEANEDGTYTLAVGRYNYSVSADKYQTATGTFAVITGSRTVTITLEGLTYPVYFYTYNTNGEALSGTAVTIKNAKGATQSPVEDDSNEYALKTGTYTYSVSATDYYTQTGTFLVEEGGGSVSVTLYGDIDVASAALNIINADGDKVSGVTVTIYNEEGGEVEVYSDGYYKLYPGDYTWTATADNYKDESGSFTITDEMKNTYITIDIEMLNPIVWVYFEVVPLDAEVVVYDSEGAVVEAYAAGEYKLEKGDYTYVISADGYETATGSFTITTSGKTIEIDLESSDAAENATVLFISNGGSSVSSQLVTIGEKIVQPDDPTRTGYDFAGWYKESTLTTPWDFDTDVVTADTTLYAKWTAKTYNIIYMFGDEVLTGLEPSTHTYGTAVTSLPTPEIEGYHFMYWCSDSALTEQTDRISAYKASDAVLYAYAEEDTGVYTVTFESNGGTDVDSVQVSEETDYLVTKPEDPTKDGYEFAGWYKDSDLTVEFNFETDTVSWHTTLYAKWTDKVYTITYYDGEEELTGLTPSTYSVSDSVLSLPSPTKTGYVFAGWYSDADLTVRVRTIAAGTTGDLVLYAKWGSTQDTVPDDCDYEPDEDGNYPETDDEGYTLIYTQEQLEAMTLCDTSVKYRLAQSILLTGDWSPIGTSSSSYFAGTLDGAGHTIAGLSIQSTSQAQGIFGYTYGATIKNLKLYGSVQGGAYTGSLIGNAYSYTVVKNVVADVDVTSTGTSVGGIIGYMSSGTVTNCINYGDVTCNGSISTATCIRATGGIVGSTAAFSSSGVNKITYCANYGDVTSSVCTPTGGILGYASNSSNTIQYCYNMGDLTQTGTDYTKYGSVCGIVGYVQGTSTTISRCYSAGAMSATKKCAGITVYQSSAGASRCFYLEGTGDYGLYYLSSSASTPSAVADVSGTAESFAYSDTWDYSEMISSLGSSYYEADTDGTLNGGYPVLSMHYLTEAALTIEVVDALSGSTIDNAVVTINGEEITASSVSVPVGMTDFTVEAEGYDGESGRFYMGPEDLTLTVELDTASFTYSIRVQPADADFALTNETLGAIEPDSAETEDDTAVYTYTLRSSSLYGSYSYTASKFLYETGTGSFDATAAGSLTVSLSEADYNTVTFDITPSDAELTLTLDGTVIEPYEGFVYHLEDGTYDYTIKRDGYDTYTASVTISGDKYISVVLTVYDGWDGSTTDDGWYDEDADTYYIYTAEEFAYFAEICTDGTNFSGKTVYLMADIDLNEQSWTPIGTYSSSSNTGFMGTFEGYNHTISGLKVSSSSTNRCGLFSYAYKATIQNLTVEGSVSAYNYSAGIAGTARACTFENVTSYVDVTATGYQIGGIVGQATYGGTYTRCRNYGTITTTAEKTGTNSYALGGIIGAATSGSAEIEYCVNRGDVSGYLQSVGGVVGYAGATSGSVSPAISYCYNTGTVTNSYESGYAGGIIGRFYGSYNSGSIYGTVNLGAVSGANSSATGGIIGYDSGTSVTIEENYYYYTTADLGVGGETDAEGVAEAFGSEADNEYETVVEALSEAYTLDSDGAIMLRWEDASGEYTVTFAPVYDTEDNRASSSSRPTYTVTNGSEEFAVSTATGTVSLPNGTYSYTAGEEGYADTSGTFTVSSLDMEVEVDLTAVLYDLTIAYTPTDAELTVENASGTELEAVSDADGTAVYSVTNGTYTYSASCYGYTDASGQVDVSYGAASAALHLASSTTVDVSFKVKADSATFTDSPVVSIYQDGTKVTSFTGTSGTETLPVGTYSYIARASGFTTASAEFTVTEDMDAVEITLAAKEAGTIIADTYWYYEDTDAEEYTISTIEELYGLAELVNEGVDEFDGRTVTMANDISMENSAWDPIGSYDGYQFMGTFDGGGHVLTISNGTMSGTEITFGLFGYLEDAAVTDLILRGSVSITHSSDSTSAVVVYVGSLAGYATGSTVERVSNQLNVTVEAEIGSSGVLDVGGLIGWVTNSTINSCSNTGMITADLETLGIGTNNAALSYTGGIVGLGTSMSSYPLKITSCYNIGAIYAYAPTAQAAGIIGALNSSGSSAVLSSCYNAGSITANDGSGTTGAFTGSSSVSGTTKNNYYLEGTAESSFGTCVTSEELMSESVVDVLGDEYEYVSGNYPKLYWEQTLSSVSIYTNPDKTSYNDMEDFDETGLELLATYADGTTEVITSGWAVLDGSDLRVNKEGETTNSTETVNVNISYRGLQTYVPVTVTQVVHTIDSSELSLSIPAPAAGETAEALTLDQGDYTVSVTWTKDGEDVTGSTFEENEFYRAEITLNAYYVTGEVWYDFGTDDTPTVDEALEVLYKRVSTVSENDDNRTRMTATVTFPATSDLADDLTAKAFHKYYEGDDNVTGSYANKLDTTLTITLGSDTAVYTLKEIEELALGGMGLEETYTVYDGASRTNTVYTGISLYKLCKKTGMFKDSLSDSTVVTIGSTSYTWGQIRTKGYSYDAEGTQTGSGLPAMLAFGSDGMALGSTDGPLMVVIPMTALDDVNSGSVSSAVTDISVTDPVYADTCAVQFTVTAEDGTDLTDAAVVTLTDDGDNEIEPEDGIFTLNIGSNYDYKITADGYGTQYGETGELSGDTVIPITLVPVWDGETLTEPEYSGGYYLISTAEELMWYNANDGGSTNLRLMADIYLNSDGEYVNTWEPMNTSETNTGSFSAIFDGNGHTIYNLYIDYENLYTLEEAYDGSPLLLSTRADVLGMFGYVSGVIKDLGVTGRIDVLDRPDDSLASWMQLGVLAGYLYQGASIEGCYTDVDISYTVGTETTTTADYPDCGYPEYCDTYVGGIAGSVVKGTVSNCYTTGDISAVGTRTVNIGGITGGMRSSSAVVEYCYATGDLSGEPSEIASDSFSSGIGSIAGSSVSTVSTDCGSIMYCFGLSSSIDLEIPDGLYGYANRVLGDDTAGAVSLSYNYGSAEMTFDGNATHDNENFSRSSQNGASITLARAKESLKPYTNVGWSAEIWKSDSSEVLPNFIWQSSGTEVVTYAVTIEESTGLAAVNFTGGVTENEDGSYTTTNTSTVTFTIDMDTGITLNGVSVTGGSLTTAGGYYTVSNITGPLTITIDIGVTLGDVNHDGAVNTKDAVLIGRYLEDAYTLDAYGLLAADVNGDGVIDASDEKLIKRYVAGTIDSFPAAG